MLHARLQIFHVRGRECVLIQAVYSRVDLLHGPAEIAHKRAAFARQVVNSSFSGTANVGVWSQKSLWLPGWHHHAYEAIAEQTGASDGEFASFGNLNVIINL
jgi:hypothetical protein